MSHFQLTIYTRPFALLALATLLTGCSSGLFAPEPAGADARVISLSAAAYAGSSINVMGGSRQTLYTDRGIQYAGFYDPEGQLVLAKRRVDEEHWQTQTTGFRTRVEDAHNTLSLIADGDGYLHVAWGHHNTPLSYAVSREPGGLELGEPRSMIGRDESSVTYPQFFRLSTGDLLFLYRDGGSGDGRLVMNHFERATRAWSRRQDNLIDGEKQRSAYWDLAVDHEDVLHLAWNWRETPDVASNHDIAYARSTDGGRNWETIDGERYPLPITASSARLAVAIEQNHNLMNPPSVGFDRWGRPFIANYWSPAPGLRPRFHLVYHDRQHWQLVPGPESGEDFELRGHGTRRPPISRAALLVESDAERAWAHLIYRDDSRGNRVVAATLPDLNSPEWHYRYLTDEGVGAWEPSIDPAQWQHMGQAHLLLQVVQQLDGDDQTGSAAARSPLGLLQWHPDLGRDPDRATRPLAPPINSSREVTAE